MNITSALLLASGALGISSTLAAGRQELAESYEEAALAEKQAALLEDQAKTLEAAKKSLIQRKHLESYRYFSTKSRMTAMTTSRVAYSGLKLSGSPLAVMVNNLAEAELDEAITKYNIDMERYNVYARQKSYLAEAEYTREEGRAAVARGKSAVKASRWRAFSQLLGTGFTYTSRYGLPKWGGKKENKE